MKVSDTASMYDLGCCLYPQQELERGLDAMLAVYGQGTSGGGSSGDMDAEAGPSAPAPAAPPKKKPSRPAKKPRALATRGAL